MASSRLHLPADAQAEITNDSFEDLVRVYDELEVPGHRVELIDGRIVVSPSGSRLHGRIILRLYSRLAPLEEERGWEIQVHHGLYVPVNRDRYQPDLMVFPGAAPDYDVSHVVGHNLLLAAEVVSPGSVRDDWQYKPIKYALAGVPLFLRIDPETQPATVTLMSQPKGSVYDSEVSVEVPTPLELPEPFGITLDTGKLFR